MLVDINRHLRMLYHSFHFAFSAIFKPGQQITVLQCKISYLKYFLQYKKMLPNPHRFPLIFVPRSSSVCPEICQWHCPNFQGPRICRALLSHQGDSKFIINHTRTHAACCLFSTGIQLGMCPFSSEIRFPFNFPIFFPGIQHCGASLKSCSIFPPRPPPKKYFQFLLKVENV